MNQFTKCENNEVFGLSEAKFDRDDNTVSVNGQTICRVNAFDLQGMDAAETANGELIAKTFTVATRLNEHGFNVDAVLSNLPDILIQLELAGEYLDITHLQNGVTQRNVEKLLAKIKINNI